MGSQAAVLHLPLHPSTPLASTNHFPAQLHLKSCIPHLARCTPTNPQLPRSTTPPPPPCPAHQPRSGAAPLAYPVSRRYQIALTQKLRHKQPHPARPCRSLSSRLLLRQRRARRRGKGIGGGWAPVIRVSGSAGVSVVGREETRWRWKRSGKTDIVCAR